MFIFFIKLKIFSNVYTEHILHAPYSQKNQFFKREKLLY